MNHWLRNNKILKVGDRVRGTAWAVADSHVRRGDGTITDSSWGAVSKWEVFVLWDDFGGFEQKVSTIYLEKIPK